MTEKHFFVYIMTNKKEGVLYIGITNDLERRVQEHKYGKVEGFTKKCNLDKLVYFEQITDVVSAITREKQIKNWRREWKINLIVSKNPEWRDLSKNF